MRINQQISHTYTVTEGVSSYTVNFPLYEQDDVAVFVSSDGGEHERQLARGTDYAVAVLADHSGGTVTLEEGAAAPGDVLVLCSALPATQELSLSSVSALDTKAMEMQLDRQVQMIQQLRNDMARTLRVAITSPRTPEEVLEEILETAATANEYAKMAEKTYEEVVRVSAEVEEIGTSVEQSRQTVEASEQNVTELAAQVLQYEDEMQMVAENIESIEAIGAHTDAMSAIAADLQGYPIYEFDGGRITEENQSMNGVGGVMRICAENIEAIRRVAGCLGDIDTLGRLADEVTEIGQTDYVFLVNNGEA